MPDEREEQHAPDREIVSSDQKPEPSAPDLQPAAVEVYTSSSHPYGSTTEDRIPDIARDKPQALAQRPAGKTPPPPPPSSPPEEEEENDEEKGMLRMSFMGHLEELRWRILRALLGVVVAFLVSLSFAEPLWRAVSAPAVDALKHLHINPPKLVVITPMEGFNIIWLKMPLLVSVFLASPWILYQVWAFISPGLYRREKRWAVPFILCTAGLFIAGGCFAYFVAFRFGLEFLLGIGRNADVLPMVSINEYFDLFVNVTLGVGLVFEMPVIIFFLTLLRLASPRFLLRHSRYAILAITIIAAVVTPTPDVFNMMLFAVPMVLLYFVGLFASYLLVLRREGKSFPWRIILIVVTAAILASSAVVALLVYRYHYHFIQKWPYFVK
ncbi:MAG: twin-arginine translocase subunit TatC [Acidobacteriaceae bacterium]|nr:twin-arginine translocase subunit TatC [Acidobacteriaceae bacterium]